MKMEYTAEILRGWPADGARERLELVRQGTVLVNGDVVSLQVDGTVDKVGSTKSRRVGLVIRGNGDSASDANANGRFMTPTPVQALHATAGTALVWSNSTGTGIVTVTMAAAVLNHGYAVGNVVTIAGSVGATVPGGFNGTFTILSRTDTTFTYALAVTPGTCTTTGTVQQTSLSNNTGKALVLWGNYIARISNFTSGPQYLPGSPITAVSGKFTLSTDTAIDVASLATITATTTAALAEKDAVLGHVIKVQGATATETAHLTIVVY